MKTDGAEPKARVTLNLPAPVYRDIELWAIEAASVLGVPRVSVQDAMRAMLTVCLTGPNAKAAAIADLQLRRQQGDQVRAGRGQRSTAD